MKRSRTTSPRSKVVECMHEGLGSMMNMTVGFIPCSACKEARTPYALSYSTGLGRAFGRQVQNPKACASSCRNGSLLNLLVISGIVGHMITGPQLRRLRRLRNRNSFRVRLSDNVRTSSLALCLVGFRPQCHQGSRPLTRPRFLGRVLTSSYRL